MTREDIEQLNVLVPYCFETDQEEHWYNIGLKHGLEIADEEPNLERLWHDAVEEPRCNEFLLGEDTDGIIIYMWCVQEDNWEAFVNETGLNRWAYIDDLLPKGGKK